LEGSVLASSWEAAATIAGIAAKIPVSKIADTVFFILLLFLINICLTFDRPAYKRYENQSFYRPN
jgi:hypothetical protein